MVSLHPFRGLRYNTGTSGGLLNLVAPPYDVVGPDARDALARRSASNVIHIELPTGGDDRYARAGDLLRAWRREAVVTLEHAPALYVLSEEFTLNGAQLQRLGVLAAVSVVPWSTGAVLPHEHTMPGPKLDRLRLLQATRTNVSPIFVMYDDTEGRIRSALERSMMPPPTASLHLAPGQVEHAATVHRLWAVTDPTLLSTLVEAFQRSQAYMADGHHRYETALTYRQEERAAHPAAPDGPWDAALMYLAAVDDPGLAVLPIHRVVRGLPVERLSRLAEGLARLFRLEQLPADAPVEASLARLADAGGGAMLFAGLGAGLTLARPRYDLATLLPAERSAAWRALDVSVLHSLILEPLLGLGDEEIKSERYVQYTRDAEEAVAAVRGGAQLAALLTPTRPEQVCAVARAHDRMPQKSTFFYPKPLTGLVLYPHEQ